MNSKAQRGNQRTKSRPSRPLLAILTLGLFTLCLLTSCAHSPQVIIQTEIIRVAPPEHMTRQVVVPLLSGPTNGDMERWARAAVDAAREANLRLEALREWARGGKEGSDVGKGE